MADQKGNRCVLTRLFTAGQASKATGVSYYLIDFWAKTEILAPKVLGTEPNTVRVYTFSDIVALKIAARLREASVIGTTGLKALVAYLRSIEFVDDDVDAHLLYGHRQDVKVLNRQELEAQLPTMGDIYVVFPLGNEVASLKEIASKLKPPKRGRASLVSEK